MTDKPLEYTAFEYLEIRVGDLLKFYYCAKDPIPGEDGPEITRKTLEEWDKLLNAARKMGVL